MIIRPPFNIHVRRFDLCLDGPGTGPALWTPAASNFFAVWIGDDIAGSDGDPVSLWPDLKGNLDATAAGSARPTLVANAANGKAGVAFDSVDDWLNFAYTEVSEATGWGVVAVITRPEWVGQQVIGLSWAASAVAISSADGVGVQFGVGISNGSTVYGVQDAARTLSIKSARSDGLYRINGTTVVPYTSYPGAGWGINAIGRSSGAYHGGRILAVGLYIGSLSNDELDKFEGWAAHYYGITLNALHPYYSAPPYQ
jgi:hypothetical protein